MSYQFDDDDYNMHVCAECGALVNDENDPGGFISSDGEYQCPACAYADAHSDE